MPSCPTFSSTIADQLSSLSEALVERCERVAKEREEILRAEILQLREANADLRNRLQAHHGQGLEPQWHHAGPIKYNPGSELGSSIFAQPEAGTVGIGKAKKGDIDEAAKGNVAVLAGQNDISICSEQEKGGQNGQQGGNAENDVVQALEIDKPPVPGEATLHRSMTAHQGQVFRLLPELMKDEWTEEEVVDSQGKYFEKSEPVDDIVQRFVLSPSSSVKLSWDIVGIPVLGWDLVTIPLQVFSMGARGNDVMDGAGWVTLFYWTFDMPVTFMTGFYDGEGDLVMDHKKIAKQYMHGFFFLDLIIILADWLTLVMESLGDGAPGFLSNLSMLRALRISRFIRLMRLRKLKSKIQALEDNVDNEWTLVIINLISKIFSILVLNHYIGCIWFWISDVQGIIEDDPNHRWLSSVPWPQYGPNRKVMADAPWDFQYFTALHWAIAQFTPGPQNIQPQNSVERVFAIFILLFGMVVFSSFIASVTQARMQLNKMMSKFERDNWLLRKFCRQHRVSRELQHHMKRYIDLVVIPNYHKLTMNDVVLLPKLSAHLRSELNTELASQHLCVHPFFKHLQNINKAIMNSVCNTAIEALSMARGDVAFCAGQVATHMFLVTAGVLDYIPVAHTEEPEATLETHHWCPEAVLWTHWTHQGQLQASIESAAFVVNGHEFRLLTHQNGFVSTCVRAYGLRFCEGLTNVMLSRGCMPSDLHEQVARDVDMAQFQSKSTGGWLDNLSTPSSGVAKALSTPSKALAAVTNP